MLRSESLAKDTDPGVIRSMRLKEDRKLRQRQKDRETGFGGNLAYITTQFKETLQKTGP